MKCGGDELRYKDVIFFNFFLLWTFVYLHYGKAIKTI